MVKELKNVMTSMMEDRTEGLSVKSMAGETIWPKPTFEQSPTRKARCRLLEDWHKAIASIVKGLTAEVEVSNEYWKLSLRKRDSGEQARATEHVFSAELVTELMAGTTENDVQAKDITVKGPVSHTR